MIVTKFVCFSVSLHTAVYISLRLLHGVWPTQKTGEKVLLSVCFGTVDVIAHCVCSKCLQTRAVIILDCNCIASL